MKRLPQGCLAAAPGAATTAPGALFICTGFAGDAADDDIIDIYPSGVEIGGNPMSGLEKTHNGEACFWCAVAPMCVYRGEYASGSHGCDCG